MCISLLFSAACTGVLSSGLGIILGLTQGHSNGEEVRVKAHGDVIAIEIEGVIVAKVNEQLQLQSIDVWFDPMDLFRQIVKAGGVTITTSSKGSEDASGPAASGARQTKSETHPAAVAAVVASTGSPTGGGPVMRN